jgi:hypothetical protein
MRPFKNNKRAFEPGNVIYSNQAGNLEKQQYAEQVQRSKETALVSEYDKQAAIVKQAEDRLAKAPTYDTSKLDAGMQAEVAQKQQEKQQTEQWINKARIGQYAVDMGGSFDPNRSEEEKRGAEIAANVAQELVLGSNPVTGVPWSIANLAQSAENVKNDASAENIGWVIADSFFTLLSFLPLGGEAGAIAHSAEAAKAGKVAQAAKSVRTSAVNAIAEIRAGREAAQSAVDVSRQQLGSIKQNLGNVLRPTEEFTSVVPSGSTVNPGSAADVTYRPPSERFAGVDFQRSYIQPRGGDSLPAMPSAPTLKNELLLSIKRGGGKAIDAAQRVLPAIKRRGGAFIQATEDQVDSILQSSNRPRAAERVKPTSQLDSGMDQPRYATMNEEGAGVGLDEMELRDLQRMKQEKYTPQGREAQYLVEPGLNQAAASNVLGRAKRLGAMALEQYPVAKSIVNGSALAMIKRKGGAILDTVSQLNQMVKPAGYASLVEEGASGAAASAPRVKRFKPLDVADSYGHPAPGEITRAPNVLDSALSTFKRQGGEVIDDFSSLFPSQRYNNANRLAEESVTASAERVDPIALGKKFVDVYQKNRTKINALADVSEAIYTELFKSTHSPLDYNPDEKHKNVPIQGKQLALAANNAYSENAVDLEGYDIVKKTPTLTVYKQRGGNLMLVAIRGTADKRDIQADAIIPLGMLRITARFKDDQAVLKALQSQYSPSLYNYVGVGHSLGGAVLDEFLKDKTINAGVSFNPAVQPLDVRDDTIENFRIYDSEDPLYKMMGRFTKNPYIVKHRPQLTEKLLSARSLPGGRFKDLAAQGYTSLRAHKLDNFV